MRPEIEQRSAAGEGFNGPPWAAQIILCKETATTGTPPPGRKHLLGFVSKLHLRLLVPRLLARPLRLGQGRRLRSLFALEFQVGRLMPALNARPPRTNSSA